MKKSPFSTLSVLLDTLNFPLFSEGNIKIPDVRHKVFFFFFFFLQKRHLLLTQTIYTKFKLLTYIKLLTNWLYK